MGVRDTLIKRARDNHFIVDSKLSSLDYGIVVSCDNGFSAPERDVEYVSVPGRNGDLIIDNGKWNNVKVTYNDCLIEDNFPEKFADFRSKLTRMKGYKRLEDTFDPDVYRMANIEDIEINTLGTRYHSGVFDITFNCKPQRFLKSGDIPLQFMPWVPSSYRTQYIPAVNGDNPTIIAHCPVGDTLSFTFSTYNSEYTRVSYVEGTLVNEQKFNALLLSTDAYWRFEITDGITDPDLTYCEIKAHTMNDGEEMEINAIFTGLWIYHNPTGYAAKPLIECYGGQLPYITWTNYVDGVEDFYYDFHTNATGETHFWMDCDTQYLYDDDKNNLTNYLILTTTGTDTGEGMEFPELGEDEIRFEMSFPDSDPANGLGIVNIWPRWYRL